MVDIPSLVRVHFGLTHRDRLHRMFNPRRSEAEEILTPDQCPATATFRAERDADVAQYGLVGHNEQMQFLPAENVGFTDFLKTTHRQNFRLPPRAHRSFPFAELL